MAPAPAAVQIRFAVRLGSFRNASTRRESMLPSQLATSLLFALIRAGYGL
jgi:hypothetical protein